MIIDVLLVQAIMKGAWQEQGYRQMNYEYCASEVWY